ncbi:heme/hemin ABC transporter substrate-binding protein [Pseudohongiella spirulinae]|uniref:Hemin ABC transporter, periplasmic hemin-binding protein n=1 Tax=Pseudohongiella spirulinae TaxID=1249552 RepID=A0A0S2KGJ3_9GAMM|nr:ABC transporter substrate-binding protein [Pseudohongiella spirulinae]ALO47156.1 Hemin ABC transporter, periplasmic hemin-binding protein [Pseudohongiella spirulinae]
MRLTDTARTSTLLLICLTTLMLPSIQADTLSADSPQRLISTDAGATEILIALGVADRLVAVDDSSQTFIDHQLPRLGYHRALAAEGLMALSPDLIIGSDTMGPPHVVDALSRARIPLLQLNTPLTVGELASNITTLSAAMGVQESKDLLQELENIQQQLQNDTNNKPLSAAFLLRAEGGKLRMAGSDTAGHAFVELIGASNLADYQGYRSLSPEAVLEMQPDLLLFADTQGGGAAALLADMPVLRFSSAHEKGYLLLVDPNALVGGISLAALDEALRIKNILQP